MVIIMSLGISSEYLNPKPVYLLPYVLVSKQFSFVSFESSTSEARNAVFIVPNCLILQFPSWRLFILIILSIRLSLLHMCILAASKSSFRKRLIMFAREI